MTRLQQTAATLYIIMGIVTFGHAYNGQPTTYMADLKVVSSLMAGAFWPLYVSTEVWEVVE